MVSLVIVYRIQLNTKLFEAAVSYLMIQSCIKGVQVIWRLRKKFIGKISHHCMKMGKKFKNMMENKWKIMGSKKKKP